MTTQTRKRLLATLGLVALFAVYETVKTLLFPQMGVVTSHVISTIVVGVITIVIGQYVVRQQTSLLRERDLNNQRLLAALDKSSRDENLLRAIVGSIDEGLIIIDRQSNLLLVNDAAGRFLNIGGRT
ncbi:MAG: PAS domain-containing protein, partial [Acidobacteriota bacterium]